MNQCEGVWDIRDSGMKVFNGECVCICLPFQSVHANGVATESKAAVRRNPKNNKKAGGKSGKEGTKKTNSSRGRSLHQH